MAIADFPLIWTIPDSSSAETPFVGSDGLTAYNDYRIEFVKDADGKFNWRCYLDTAVLGGATISAVKIKFQVYANAMTGATRMQALYKAVADGESLNPASLTAATAEDVTVPATAYLRKEVTATLTAGDFASGDVVIGQLFHDGDHANDTLAVNTLVDLSGAYIEVTF